MVSKRKINRRLLTSYIFVLSIFLSVWAPFTSGSSLGNEKKQLVVRVLLFLAVAIIALIGSYRNKFSVPEIIIIISPIIYYLFCNYIHVYNSGFRTGTSTLLFCILLAIQVDEIKINTFIIFKRLFVVVVAMGIIFYMCYVLKIGIPYKVEDYYVSLALGRQHYINYFNLCYIYTSIDNDIRLCSILNEPGWLGTLSALILCVDDLNIKKKDNMIIFIAGMLTFSAAYVIIMVAYLMLKWATNIKHYLMIFLFIVLWIFVLPNVSTNNENVNFLINKVVLDGEGILGNSRMGKFSRIAFEETLRNYPLFGYGAGYAQVVSKSHYEASLSFMQDIINYGLIGTFLIYVPCLYSIIKCGIKQKRAIFFIVIFILSLWQRPWMYEPSTFTMIICGICYIKHCGEDDYELVGI